MANTLIDDANSFGGLLPTVMERFTQLRRPRAVLVEITPNHGWVLFSQCLLVLEQGFDLTVVVHEKNDSRELLSTVACDRLHIKVVRGGSVGLLVAVLREQLRKRADLVTINTLDGRSIWLTAMVSLGPLTIILHNLDDFGFGRARRIGFLARLLLARSRKLIVLSPKLQERAAQILPASAIDRIAVFFPMSFGSSDRGESTQIRDRFTALVLGRVCSKRNYDSLAAIFSRLTASHLMDRVVIKIVGDASNEQGQRLRACAADAIASGRIEFGTNSGFVSNQEFLDVVASADCILPLIDRRVVEEWGYNQSKAPSSLMMSRAFSVPLICSTDLDLDDDLRPFALIYDEDRVWDGLVAAVQAHQDGTLARMKTTMLKRREDWIHASARSYLDHVGGCCP